MPTTFRARDGEVIDSIGSDAIPALPLTVMSNGTMKYVTGGVGDEEVAQLKSLESLLPVAGATSFIRQQSPQGLGHAVWCARDVIGNEPFALLLPDMVSFGGRGCLSEVMDLYEQSGGNVIAVERCDPSETNKYGIVGRGAEVGSGFEVTAMVEKPMRNT